MVIKRELNLSLEQACAVCGPLGGGAKTSLMLSLIALSGKCPSLSAAIKKFQSMVGRNALAHGFISAVDSEKEWYLVTREVKDKLVIKTRNLDAHFQKSIIEVMEEVQAAANVNDQQLHDYGLEILNLALARANPA